MAHHDIVAIGASAGGFLAPRDISAALPADLPASILVTLHLPREGADRFAETLAAASRVPIAFARDAEPIAWEARAAEHEAEAQLVRQILTSRRDRTEAGSARPRPAANEAAAGKELTRG